MRSAVYPSLTMFMEIGHSVPSLASELAVYWALNPGAFRRKHICFYWHKIKPDSEGRKQPGVFCINISAGAVNQ